MYQVVFFRVFTLPSSFSLCHIWRQGRSLNITLNVLALPIAIDCHCLLLGARLLCRVGFFLFFQF